MAETDTKGSENLERDLEKMLEDNEKFEPSEEFKKNALWNDPSIYEEAEKDTQAWWAGHAVAASDANTEITSRTVMSTHGMVKLTPSPN